MGKYRTAFSMGILSSMEYRFDFFIGFIGMIFPIVIQVFLWLAVYGGTGDEEMYGYNFSQMIAYVVIASLVGRVVNTGVESTINNDIHSGGLAKYLVTGCAGRLCCCYDHRSAPDDRIYAGLGTSFTLYTGAASGTGPKLFRVLYRQHDGLLVD